MRFRTQTLVLQCAIVALVLAAAFSVFAYSARSNLSGEYQQRALAVARVVASEPQIRSAVAGFSASHAAAPEMSAQLAAGVIQEIALQAQTRTASLFVVVTDDRGVRLAHPDPSQLGRAVSTDPSGALSGAEVLAQERGTLGDSARAKVPVLEPNSNHVVGEVSVGVSTDDIRNQLLGDLVQASGVALGALVLGIAGSLLLTRRLKRLTLGLEPEELAGLVQEHEAVLRGIGDGVLAVDRSGVVTLMNDEARRLLNITDPPGRDIAELALPQRVIDVVRTPTQLPALVPVGSRVLVLIARTVTREGRDLGTVLTVRDRTDVESLTRQLDAVQTMSTVLRAQRHEFANRLHLVNGLLHTGKSDEAQEYIATILQSGPLGGALANIDAISDPYLQAFLAAKAAHARESGVVVTVGEGSWVDNSVALPVDVTTVLGNLLDNAIEAARVSVARPAVVEVELVAEGSTLFVTVSDTGDGVHTGADIFVEGVSTRGVGVTEGGTRGVGLALARQIALGLSGDVYLAESSDVGAVFVARLPGVLVQEELV